MKILAWTLLSLASALISYGETPEDRASLLKTTAALRDAFARGDVEAADARLIKLAEDVRVRIRLNGIKNETREPFQEFLRGGSNGFTDVSIKLRLAPIEKQLLIDFAVTNVHAIGTVHGHVGIGF